MKFSVLIVIPALLLVSCDQPLSPKDTAPLTVVVTEPADGAMDVPITSAVSVTFSRAVDPATISASTFFVTEDSVAVPGSVSTSGRVARLLPSDTLAYATLRTPLRLRPV